MKAYTTYFMLFFLLFAACKKEYKYPEDTKKTRKSPNERLSGSWFISEYFLNGISIKDTLSKLSNWDITWYRIEYYNQYDKWRFDVVGNSPNYYRSFGTDNAFNDFHYITLNSFSEIFNKTFVMPFKSVPNTTTKWTVTKLYDRDLHLQLVTDTGEYKIIFNKR